MLGEAGATVYCTGRSIRGKLASGNKRPETIEETAEMVTARGGRGIFVQVDHTVAADVEKLFDRVKSEQGRLDILVNDVWGGDDLTEFGTPFWKLSLEKGLRMLQQAVCAHIITSRYGTPLMLQGGGRLIVEITDGDFFCYRGNLFYDLSKMAAIRLAFDMARELRKKNVAAVALTPGFLRSESMLDRFGVTEANWQEAGKKDPHFLESETPYYVGRAVAALAADADVMQKSGRVFSSWELAVEYGFRDVDGRQPHWSKHYEEEFKNPYPKADEAAYSFWRGGAVDVLFADWPK